MTTPTVPGTSLRPIHDPDAQTIVATLYFDPADSRYELFWPLVEGVVPLVVRHFNPTTALNMVEPALLALKRGRANPNFIDEFEMRLAEEQSLDTGCGVWLDHEPLLTVLRRRA